MTRTNMHTGNGDQYNAARDIHIHQHLRAPASAPNALLSVNLEQLLRAEADNDEAIYDRGITVSAEYTRRTGSRVDYPEGQAGGPLIVIPCKLRPVAWRITTARPLGIEAIGIIPADADSPHESYTYEAWRPDTVMPDEPFSGRLPLPRDYSKRPIRVWARTQEGRRSVSSVLSPWWIHMFAEFATLTTAMLQPTVDCVSDTIKTLAAQEKP